MSKYDVARHSMLSMAVPYGTEPSSIATFGIMPVARDNKRHQGMTVYNALGSSVNQPFSYSNQESIKSFDYPYYPSTDLNNHASGELAAC